MQTIATSEILATMPRLLYHAQSANSENVSPFDEAALLVVTDGPIRLASPYLGISYLEHLLGDSPDWRIISDVQEWLTSLSQRARPRAWSFIRQNLEKIHHCSALHAKVVIGATRAMLGSANFTRAGMLHRAEMGILLEDKELVAELTSWFDGLWSETSSPVADEANEFIQWLDTQAARAPTRRQAISIVGKNNAIRAKLVLLARTEKKSESSSAPIRLAEVARAVIVAEQFRFESIVQAFDAAIKTAALLPSFSFRQFREIVKGGFPDATNREIYLRILSVCSNHPRTAFIENTTTEFTIVRGGFVPSTPQLVLSAIKPFDDLLVFLVESLRFDTFLDMPSEAEIRQQTQIEGGDQLFIFTELLECGFLEIEDLPGSLPRCRLVDAFAWEDHFCVYGRGRTAWLAATQRPYKMPIGVGEELEQRPVVKLKMSPYIFPRETVEEISWETLVRDESAGKVAREADQVRLANERIQKIDTVLRCVLTSLFAGEKLVDDSVEAIALRISEQCGVGVRLVEKVLTGTSETAKVLRLSRNFRDECLVDINPQFTWDDIQFFPETRKACEVILGRQS